MLTYPQIDPVAVHLGPLAVHWYGLMYLVGMIGGWGLALVRARKLNLGWSHEQVTDLIFYTALGVVFGGRIGYMLIYDLPGLISNPISLFKLWQGGMSFHGGLIGVVIAVWLYARKVKMPFIDLIDFIAPLVPIGLGAGRIGNFINGELVGRITNVPWAMIFPNGGPFPRHPSQLYEFLMEGVLLFTILWIFSSKPRPRMAVSGLFALLYGSFRIIGECFRQPDVQMGFFAFNLTMGQILSIPLVLLGMTMLWLAYRKKN